MVKEWKQLKCSICGGELTEHGNKLACKYCRAIYECVERISEDEVIQLNQATVQRNLLLFDDAYERYELILKSYPSNSEAAWGAFLCSYGIIYEQDYDGTYKPTCHRLNECPVEKSPYYSKLTGEAKNRAKEIENLRQSILAQAKSISPYDVFICYKATDDWHGRSMPTKEANWARDIYEMLTRDMGLKVFFAEKCLSGSNTDYEPHIYSALQSAKLMLVLANSLDHVNAVWVQNEWRRYAKYIREGKEKTIRVIFDQIEPYSLPRELQAKQAICHDSMGWDRQLQRSIEEIFKKEEPKKDARDEELEFLRKQIEELKKAQTAQANASRPTPTPTPAPTQTISTTPSLPDFEIKNGVLQKYNGKSGKVTVPNSVTEIGMNSFWGNEKVTEIVLPNTVKTISASAFAFCENLKSINLPKSLTTIDDDCFYSCECLTSIIIPNSVTVVGENAFLYCDSLSIKAEAIKKPQGWHEKWNPSNCPVTWGHNTTATTATKPQSTFPATPLSYFDIKNGVLTKYKGNGGKVIIPNTVTKIGEYAFYYCDNLVGVVIPNSVTSIGENAFASCEKLTSVSIPNSVTSIASFAFDECTSLTRIVIPRSVTTIGMCAFNECTKLTIYCEAKSKPSGWVDQWNSSYLSNVKACPVVWGHNNSTTTTTTTTSTTTQSNQGLADSLFNKGWEFHQKKDYVRAVEFYLKACEYNHKVAQNNLAVCYANGLGVPQDKAKAVEYYQKSANQGYMLAQNNLGHCYQYGNGVAVNYQKAVEWYEKSVAQNCDLAQYNLGNCYYHGHGVAKDYYKAVSLYQKSADQGNANAQYNAGNCYYHGYGVAKDFTKAVQYFEKSAAQGNANAQYNLSVCYYNGDGVTKDLTKAAQLALTSANKGFPDAQNRIGFHYLHGLGVAKNYTEAIRYFNMVAGKNMYAQYNLGYCYENGFGVTKNLYTAIDWYQKASNLGHASSTKKVTELKQLLGIR